MNCNQLVLAEEVHQKVNWMWLANVSVVFGLSVIKRNMERAHDNVLLLCAYMHDAVSNNSP